MQHNEAGRTVDGGGGNWIGGDRCEGEVSDEGGRGEEWKSLMEEYEMAIEKEGERDRWVKRERKREVNAVCASMISYFSAILARLSSQFCSPFEKSCSNGQCCQGEEQEAQSLPAD